MNQISRKQFIKLGAAGLVLAALPSGVSSQIRTRKDRMILSFYCDDTQPGFAKAEAYREFLEYCRANGIKGEASIILGYDGKSMAANPDSNKKLFLEQAKRAYKMGIDSHMELMTHWELFDFRKGIKPDEGIHEGLWLHEPDVTVKEYQEYFSGIIAEGEKVKVKFTGLTQPGCGCESCNKRHAELKSAGYRGMNKAVFEALLNLAKDGKFRTPVLSVFYSASETNYGVIKRAADGKYGVYDIVPNARDYFGSYRNSEAYSNPDYYITDDGKSGIIIKHLNEGAPYCMWYMHWEGMNPDNGVAWDTFRLVNERIKNHLAGKVTWMRPSDIVRKYHKAGGWGFTKD